MTVKELTTYLFAAIAAFGISAVSSRAMAQHSDKEGDEEATKRYMVISKEHLTLTLYDECGEVVVQYPVAVGKNYGNKQHAGDYRTPEGEFRVQQIQQASNWGHDFGDGMGYIKNCYGNWFIRLYTPPYKSIGIHGTHLPESIGRRSTEGCICLRNEDLDALRPYIELDMRVVIEPAQADLSADNDMTTAPETEDKRAEAEEEREVGKESEREADRERGAEAEEERDSVQRATPQHIEVVEAVATDRDSGTTDEELWHTVADGDLVSRIAFKYGTSSQEIQRLNPTIDIDRIGIGQRIKVRGRVPEAQPVTGQGATKQEATRAATQTSGQPMVADAGEELWHTIEDGDYLGKIATRYNTSVRKIEALNPGMDVDKIRAGERIRVR